MYDHQFRLMVLTVFVLACVLGPGVTSAASTDADAPSTVRLWQAGDHGQRLNVRGRVLSATGGPLSGATIQLWQADGTGAYREDRYRTSFPTADDGTFRLSTVLPGQYWGAKHIHVIVSHPQHQPLHTQVLFKGDPYLSSSPEGELVMVTEEVRIEDETILVGGVEFLLQPLERN